MMTDLSTTETKAPEKRWYVIHTYSGYENKVKANLEHRIESMGMEDKIFQVLVPMEDEIEIRRLALAAFRAAGCRGWGRVDVMRDRSTGRFYLLEVNTAPGMTSHSLMPKSAAALGVPFEELCWRILETSMPGAAG